MKLNKICFINPGLCLLFLLSFFTLALPAQGYEIQTTHSNNLRLITNQKIVAKLRLRMVQRARKIDVIDYDLGGDPTIAIPFYQALNTAAHNGARVRFIRGGYLAKIYRKLYQEPSWNDPVETHLLAGPKEGRPEYVFFGGWRMMAKGWSPVAGVHEKLIIAYLDTGVVVFMPGHGLSTQYFSYRDHCTIFKGTEDQGIVADAQNAFENLWRTVHHATWRTTPSVLEVAGEVDRAEVIRVNTEPNLPLNEAEETELARIGAWMEQAPDSLPPSAPEPVSADLVTEAVVASRTPLNPDALQIQFFHHNLLDQLHDQCVGKPWIYGLLDCTDQVVDPIIEELIHLAQRATTFRLYTLGVVLDERFKSVLMNRLREARIYRQTRSPEYRDFHLEIFTNGKAAYNEFIFYPASKIAWKTGLKDINDLLQLREEKGSPNVDVKIFGFEKTEYNKLNYLHAKGAVAIMPDGSVVATSGSHNSGSRGSSRINDEMNIFIRSTPTAQMYNSLFSRAVFENGREMDRTAIYNEQWWHRLPFIGYESVLWRWMLHIAAATI